jgi:predicted CXXCH cytochrome family protein
MMRMLPTLIGVCLLAVGGGAAWAAPIDPAKPPTNEDCLMCHSDPTAARADGRLVAVKPDAFASSIHGQSGAACIDCHADLAAVTEWPHAERLKPAQCATCHEAAVQAYDRGIHAQARRRGGDMVAAACVDCHGSHDIKPSADPESRTHHMRLIETCGRCHGDEEIIKRGKIAIGNVVDLFRDSIHGTALMRSGLTVAPSCTDCHSPHEIRKSKDAKSQVFRTAIPDTCGKCHEGIVREYRTGIHGVLVAKGSPLAPVCSDCHTAHQIRRAEVAAWRLEVVKECGTCHEHSAKTFRDTFHGQVTALGYTRVAACADCHGAHAIFPKSDERSMVSAKNVTQTCRQCHEGATPRFAQYDPHADPNNRERNGFLYYTTQFMKMLLGGVFTFFGIHTALWLGRGVQMKTAARLRGRKRQKPTEDGHDRPDGD